MNFQRKKVAIALGMGGFALVAGGSVFAQDIRVDVTGSNIKRVESEGALPIQVLTREEINRTGATNAYELMNFISANNSAGNVSLGNVIGATTFSNQTASLRGLGGQATLILVNGKRIGTFSSGIQGAEGTNLSAVPFSAIERVEVLKDGASAIYGADAVAGVINFIMRQDYTGAEASVYYGAPTRSGGGDNQKYTAAFGYGDLTKDRFNAFIGVSYEDSSSLLQSERSFSNTSYIPSAGINATSGNTFPGFISTGGIGNTSFPNCAPSIVVGSRCRFDPSAYSNVQGIPDSKLLNVYGAGRFQINNDWQAYLTGMYSQQETRFVIQPVPISDQFAIPENNPIAATYGGVSRILLPPSSPFYPTAAAIAAGVNGQPLNVRYRAVENGNRDTTDTNDQWNIVAGVKGTAWNWDFDGSFSYGKNTGKEQLNGGFPQLSRILPLLNSGTVNLFGPNSAAISQAVKDTNYNGQTFNSTLTGYGIDLKASGDIMKLPAGALAAAVGIQSGREDLTQDPAPILQTGDVSGYGGNFLPISNQRTVWAVFGELNVPIIKNLEANLAVRYDHYSDFGDTTNPKIGLRYQPVPQVVLRGSWGTGFLAPTLYQLYNPQTIGVSSPGLSDPLRCPTTGDSNDCDTQFGTINGGNPNLKPTTSTQWGLGAVFEPSPGVSIGLDYFNIQLKDQATTGVPQSTILNDPQYAYLITRGPVQPAFPTLPGPIVSLAQTFVNAGATNIEGLDLDLKFRLPPSDIGRFTLSATGTYYIKYEVEQSDGSFAGFVSNQFQSSVTGLTPRFKSYVALNWTYGPWSATLGNTFQSSYIDVNTDVNDEIRRVGTLSLWDLQGAYTGFKNWTFTLGAKNLFDTDPPFTNQNNTFQVGYDPSYYDARARFVYGSIAYAFK